MSEQSEDSSVHSGENSDQETQSHDHGSHKDGSLSANEQLGLRESRAVLRLRILVCPLVCGRSRCVDIKALGSHNCVCISLS